MSLGRLELRCVPSCSAMASGMSSLHDENSMEVGFARSCQPHEGRAYMGTLRSVRAPLRGFSFKKHNDISCIVKVDADASFAEDEDSGEFGCETPKSGAHRIPVVEDHLCPPAPKKRRGVSRLALACSVESEDHGTCQEFRLAPCYLF